MVFSDPFWLLIVLGALHSGTSEDRATAQTGLSRTLLTKILKRLGFFCWWKLYPAVIGCCLPLRKPEGPQWASLSGARNGRGCSGKCASAATGAGQLGRFLQGLGGNIGQMQGELKLENCKEWEGCVDYYRRR